jgi:hypothetical protein
MVFFVDGMVFFVDGTIERSVLPVFLSKTILFGKTIGYKKCFFIHGFSKAFLTLFAGANDKPEN